MKIKTQLPEPSARESSGPRYWRSLGDLAETPAFKEWVDKEFPAGASMLEGSDRRSFLKIMAASFGLAGLGMAGCRQQTRHLLPYSKQPDRIVPGVPVYYSTSMPGPDEHIPLIVETHDARPIKVEGNPSYPAYRGATSVFAQASILDLYDPDRAQRSSTDQGPLTPAAVMDALNKLSAKYSGTGGEGLYFLADKNLSPTRARILARLRAHLPQAVWAEYEPLDNSNPEVVSGGGPGFTPLDMNGNSRPIYDFSKAKRVLSLDSDFLHTEPGHLGYSRGFAQARKVLKASEVDPEKMIRLYAVESNYSLTGANADHRLRCASSHIPGLTALLAAEVLSQTGGSSDDITALKNMGVSMADDNLAKGKLNQWVTECATDLVKHPGASVVIAGPQQPMAVHHIVRIMNRALGAPGGTLNFARLPARGNTTTATIADVAKAMDDKKVETLFILNGNPAYNAPGDLDFAAKLTALAKDKQVIRYGYYGRQADETSAIANTFIASLHYLESWGDGYTWDGVHVPVQPMIQPLFDGFGELDVLAQMSGDTDPDAYNYVRNTFAAMHGGGASFDEWLAKGVVGDGFAQFPSAEVGSRVRVDLSQSISFPTPKVTPDSLEVRFIAGLVGDGRYANNGWLQEVPDPMTKLTWDNAIYISPKLAKGLDLWPKSSMMAKGPLGALQGESVMNDNTFVTGREIARRAEITVNGKTISGWLSILPGLADNTLVVPLGYGRKHAGQVGSGVGFNGYPLVNSQSPMASCVSGATLKVLSENDVYRLANVQEHWSVEGRGILRESNVEEYQAHPDYVKSMDVEAHSPPIYGKDQDMSPQDKSTEQPRGESMYVTHPNDKPAPNVAVWNTSEGLAKFPVPQQWGMSIDLNTCLGCTACVVACQAENNIPIVGKDQVMRGREMHWIRLDRYFAAGPSSKDGNYTDTLDLPEDPQVSFQSMACQHCELAPCENVCPFMATLHDDQGLNTMAYNRCVGTKYCADNCPYKVRRFNFFDWNKREIGEFYKGPLGPDQYDTSANQLTRMQKNPDVSIRMRGVMEKCTYCVQRIESAKINQRIKAQDSGDIKVADGVIQPACAQACPTDSIVFGDVSDATSAVSLAKASDRNYAVLGYLNIRPRTTYLAKLRNPNPKMPDYAAQPLSRQEYDTRYGHKAASEAPAAAK
jgi:molybdopterin-containing oxidoreductase family iron-sulfur binding subunit